MIGFIARRLAMAAALLLLLSAIVYFLLALALDPLEDLYASSAPNKEELIAARIAQLGLDLPWYLRYGDWLAGFIRGDLGVAWQSGQPVTALLGGAIATSVQLVFAATCLALLLGVAIGLVSALRQYSLFDYVLTFVSFVLFALPVFWVAVLLKQFLAIGVNDYLSDPQLNWLVLLGISVVAGLFWAGALGTTPQRGLMAFAMAMLSTFGALTYVLLTGWVHDPQLGTVGVALVGVAAAFAVTAIFAGLHNRRALLSALATAGVGVGAYIGVQWLFFFVEATVWMLVGLLVVAVLLGLFVGWLFAGPDRWVSMRGAGVVALVMSVATYFDRVMQEWQAYSNLSIIRGRPLATIGTETPGLGGDFWMSQLDRWTHLLLPTIALVLISFAQYTRYQRGSMLEVMGQDYIRSARAKGVSERVVIVRHALRNALLPLASIVPVDFITMIGGAVITETIFGWSGMGRLFIVSLKQSEIDPVMAYIMITGALAMVANIVADLAYGLLDPRIRVTS
ncbi:MAG: ABC transporter permease [Propioniciclava sp.]